MINISCFISQFQIGTFSMANLEKTDMCLTDNWTNNQPESTLKNPCITNTVKGENVITKYSTNTTIFVPVLCVQYLIS